MQPHPAVPDGVTAEHGAYVAQSCKGCHGIGLAGGPIPGAPPSWPDAANLTPGAGSVMPIYADRAAFVAMMKSGLRPDGSRVNAVMPFTSFAAMNDVDLHALHLYFNTLAPRERGSR